MYRLTENPDILINTETGANIPRGHWMWPTEWLAAGNTPLPIPPPYELYSKEHFQAIRTAAWDWMKAVVVDRRYDSIESCCSYYNSAVPRYAAEAKAMVAWRDAVNQKLEQLVAAPPAGIETWEQVKALLPQPEAFNWPSEVDLPLDGVPPIHL